MLLRNPITGIAGCCAARAASGHDTDTAPDVTTYGGDQVKRRELITRIARHEFSPFGLRLIVPLGRILRLGNRVQALPERLRMRLRIGSK
jgi:hypothetical protein